MADLYSKIDLQSAVKVILTVEANERQIQASRRLALTLMKKFDSTFTDFSKLEPHYLAKLTDKFTHHKWLHLETYNKILSAFSVQFNNFSVAELGSIVKSLSSMGIASPEVFVSSLQRIEWIQKEYNIKPSFK